MSLLAEIKNLTYGEMTMAAAIAVGTVTAGLMAVAAMRNPAKASLRTSAGRENSIHPIIVLGIFFVWLAFGVLLRTAFNSLETADNYKDVAASLGNQFLIAGIILLMARKLFRRGLGSGGLGFSRKNLYRDLLMGAVMAMACVAICMAIAWGVIELTRLISPGYTPKDHRFLEAIDNASIGWRVAILISAVVGASLSEELIFRGMMQTMLRNYTSPWVAIVITSITFTGVHAEIQNMPSLFVLSAIIGWSYEKTGSITLPIFIHAIFNCVMISAKMI